MTRKICLYGILSSVCIVLGFLEHLVSLDFIAPGVKLGLSNSVALILIFYGDIKGAFAVNIVRILLSGLLFSSPMTMCYSLLGGISALVVMTLFSKIKFISIYGVSVLGAVSHNLAQLVCAGVLLGSGVWYYSPVLLISALICGMFTAFISNLINKRLKEANNKY